MAFTQYYFIGIGGIGMSAIARYYHVKGFAVAGYDRSETKLTSDLQAEGISTRFSDERKNIGGDNSGGTAGTRATGLFSRT